MSRQRITSFTISKNIKVPLRQYSTIDTLCSLTFEVAEGETPDFEGAYNELNRQLLIQVGHLEQSWIVKNQELRDFYKLVLKVPKYEK